MNLHHYTKSYWHLCMLTSTPWCIVERKWLPEVNQCRGQNENHLVFSHPDEPNKSATAIHGSLLLLLDAEGGGNPWLPSIGL